MKCTLDQITDIVKTNPNKSRVSKAQEMAKKLMLHVHGVGMESAIKHCEYFANKDLYEVQKQYAVSNKDMYGRLLQQEDMVFTAKGGSSYFNLAESQEKQMNGLLDDVRFGMNLRKWIRNFALQAYRSDPMGVLFMEVEELKVSASGEINNPKPYPTYKSSYSVFDYLPNGRKLEYICFQLEVHEALAFGIVDDELKNTDKSKKSNYYRFVDDEKDLIVKKKEDAVMIVAIDGKRNPIKNTWGKTPGFIASDLMMFNDPQCFLSPLSLTVELADCFLEDRSVRNLQKKFHGFGKAVEPLLLCGTCNGNGFMDGGPCKDCTVPGADKGTGFKMRTRPGDVARFPLDVFEHGFDFNKIFGYVTPDIKGWEKQDMSLEDLEELIEMTYWGTVRMKRPKPGNTQPGGMSEKTAAEVDSNDQPKEARLNMTADWAETTESMIANFIGEFWFKDSFKTSNISYGRDYIFKTPEEMWALYENMRTKGAPDFMLDLAFEKYLDALFQRNHVMLAKYKKLLRVEPFPHIKVEQAKAVITEFSDYCAKLYFGEWYSTLPDMQIIQAKPEELRKLLKAYVLSKGLKEPDLEPKPSLN